VGWTIRWKAREKGLFYARFHLSGDWHCWLSLSGLLLPAKVGSFRALARSVISLQISPRKRRPPLSAMNSTPLLFKGRAISSQHAERRLDERDRRARQCAWLRLFDTVRSREANSGHRRAVAKRGRQAFTYDVNGFIASRTDWDGNVTTFVNNVRGLPKAITEAAGTPLARTIGFSNDPLKTSRRARPPHSGPISRMITSFAMRDRDPPKLTVRFGCRPCENGSGCGCRRPVRASTRR
jgi:YD repeat-containing protein